MSPTATTTAPAVEAHTDISTIDDTIIAPTREQVIAKIVSETGCTEKEASDFVTWMNGIVIDHRKAGHGNWAGDTFHLRQHHLNHYHPVMNTIMPDKVIAVTGSGSAHDLLQQHVLDPTRGELGLVHGKAEGKVQDCTVTLTMSTTS